jgi:hypothetical protein
MSKRRLTCVLSVLGLMTFVCTASAAPAGPTWKNAGGKHCVAMLSLAGIDPTQLKAEQPECFPTFRDAIFSATKGRVLLPNKPLGEQLDILDQEIKIRLDDLSKAGSFVVAIDYENTNFGGSTLTWTSPGPCTAGSGFLAASMPGFNDKLSSTRGFSDCAKNVIWEHQNFAGTKLTCRPNCSSVGSMNDKASSREWHHLCEGVSGMWAGCRGDGCSVCSELVTNYPCYFQNHPSCISNGACGGLYSTCSDTCPAPTQADTCVCNATASCIHSGGGPVSCSGSAGTCFSVNDCYVECDGVQTSCPNPTGLCPL